MSFPTNAEIAAHCSHEALGVGKLKQPLKPVEINHTTAGVVCTVIENDGNEVSTSSSMTVLGRDHNGNILLR